MQKSNAAYSLPELMAMDIDDALEAAKGLKKVSEKLRILKDLGLGYLTLKEATPRLSGGEAQRLKLASDMGKGQEDTIFVFDEPTIGLHPLDTETLLHVFDELVSQGATVVVIEHDLDVIRNADYLIDMGPGGGQKAAPSLRAVRREKWPNARKVKQESTSKERAKQFPRSPYGFRGTAFLERRKDQRLDLILVSKMY